MCQCFFGGDALHLNEVHAFMAESRFQKPVFHFPIVRQEEEPFAVSIQSPDRVDVLREWAIRTQCPASGTVGKLTQDAVGLVEDHVGFVGVPMRAGHGSGEKKSPGMPGDL
jgi:hypothetical protein